MSKAKPAEKIKPFRGSDDPDLKSEADRMSHRQLFLLRLQREGRRDEFEQLVKKFVSAGDTPSGAYGKAQRQMGMRSAKEERLLYCTQVAKEAYVIRKEALTKEHAEARRKQADMAYQRALKSLPAVSSAEVELDWVRAHPLMSTLDRSTLRGKPRKVLVKERDILEPPHGAAPSQAAVHMLQHWANRPVDFFGKMLMEQRKGTPKRGGKTRDGDDESAGDASDDDTSELDALLGH